MFTAISFVTTDMRFNKKPIRYVVIVQKYDEISVCGLNAVVSCNDATSILIMANVNNMGRQLSQPVHVSSRVIRRTVVNNDDLESLPWNRLIQQCIESLLKNLPSIVG